MTIGTTFKFFLNEYFVSLPKHKIPISIVSIEINSRKKQSKVILKKRIEIDDDKTE